MIYHGHIRSGELMSEEFGMRPFDSFIELFTLVGRPGVTGGWDSALRCSVAHAWLVSGGLFMQLA